MLKEWCLSHLWCPNDLARLWNKLDKIRNKLISYHDFGKIQGDARLLLSSLFQEIKTQARWAVM